MGRRLRSPDRGQGKGSEGMERHELRELVEDALGTLKTRYQRTRTPFNLQTIREEVAERPAPGPRRQGGTH